jgi:hypothetical protein
MPQTLLLETLRYPTFLSQLETPKITQSGEMAKQVGVHENRETSAPPGLSREISQRKWQRQVTLRDNDVTYRGGRG